MAHGTDDDALVVDDLEQRHIARLSKADQQFADERAVALRRLAAGEGKTFEDFEPGPDRVERALGKCRVAVGLNSSPSSTNSNSRSKSSSASRVSETV